MSDHTPTTAKSPLTNLEQLGALLREAGVKPAIGLRQQGKFDTVAAMIRDAKHWDEIGAAIGWAPDAIRTWFAIEAAHELKALQYRQRLVCRECGHDLSICGDCGFEEDMSNV